MLKSFDNLFEKQISIQLKVTLHEEIILATLNAIDDIKNDGGVNQLK